MEKLKAEKLSILRNLEAMDEREHKSRMVLIKDSVSREIELLAHQAKWFFIMQGDQATRMFIGPLFGLTSGCSERILFVAEELLKRGYILIDASLVNKNKSDKGRYFLEKKI